jgi:hypothetical protein
MKIAEVLAIYALVGFWQVTAALRQSRREAVLAAGITLLGAWYSAGLVGGWHLLTPVRLIEWVFAPAAGLLGTP